MANEIHLVGGPEGLAGVRAGAGHFPEGPAFCDSVCAYLCDPTGKTRKEGEGWSMSRATPGYRKRLHFGEWMNHESGLEHELPGDRHCV